MLDSLMRGLIRVTPIRAKVAVVNRLLRHMPPTAGHPAANARIELLKHLPVVAIRARGGLGDHVVIARFIRDLFSVVGPFPFDLYTSRLEASEWIYSAIPQIRRVFSDHLMWDDYYRHYPLALDLSQFAHVPHADWMVASERNPTLARVVEHIDKYRWRIEPCILNHPNLDAHLGRIAVFHNRTRRDYMHSIAKIPYGGDAYDLPATSTIIEDLGLAESPIVTVHNGFEVDSDMARVSSTKVYPHFDAIVTRIKHDFPGLRIVQIGSSTSRPLASVDVDLISKTKLIDVAAILKASRFHLDNESGLVHIARCYETPGCVIFGPTDVDYFGYPANVNIRPEFCGNCWWHARDWMSTCVRGFDEPKCLTTRSPEDIYKTFAPVLHSALGAPHAPLVAVASKPCVPVPASN